jgi:hypothetical protein
MLGRGRCSRHDVTISSTTGCGVELHATSAIQINDIAANMRARLVFTVFAELSNAGRERSDDACFMLATVSNVSETS